VIFLLLLLGVSLGALGLKVRGVEREVEAAAGRPRVLSRPANTLLSTDRFPTSQFVREMSQVASGPSIFNPPPDRIARARSGGGTQPTPGSGGLAGAGAGLGALPPARTGAGGFRVIL